MIRGEHRDHEHRDDDPDVGSLRSTFSALSPAMFAALRESDEEPPVRGLAELLAAASAHVSALPPPSRWQRFAVAVRQPPILAATSIAILIGGALAISRPDASPVHTPAALPTAAPGLSPDLSPAARQLQQLADEAVAAAVRGDCEAARALSTRIAQQAPAYYRDRVASIAAVARCLN